MVLNNSNVTFAVGGNAPITFAGNAAMLGQVQFTDNLPAGVYFTGNLGANGGANGSTGSLVINGTGVMFLSGTNTYAGLYGTTGIPGSTSIGISGTPTVVINSASSFGASGNYVDLNAGTLATTAASISLADPLIVSIRPSRSPARRPRTRWPSRSRFRWLPAPR